ncbi:hypothetical protein BD779DRAFT_1520181 [Infundibulicybe gibba]|nr:hypothetical protein BD779DRAFT_1520181 [Infundibulicybe gibba]
MTSRICLRNFQSGFSAQSRLRTHRGVVLARDYATATTLIAKKPPPGSKPAPRKAAGSSSQTPIKPVPKGSAKKATSSITRDATPSTSATSTSSRPASSRKALSGTSYVVPEKQSSNTMTEEEQMEQRVETLDVMLPYSIGFKHRKSYPTWRAMMDQFVQNRLNGAKNATSMLLLAQANAIPGLDLSEAKFRQKFFSWPWRMFTTQSTKSNAWMAPFRNIALETYKNLNVALAQQDDKAIKQFTTSSHQDTMLRLLKKQQNPALTYIWRFHNEVTSTRVLSIRGTEGYLATEDPKIGNRMMMHALVKFDTEQSLEIYDRRGNALHTPAQGQNETRSEKQQAVRSATSYRTVPAERKRVTEYLVMEKRMWYDGPWTFREQMWEVGGKKGIL